MTVTALVSCCPIFPLTNTSQILNGLIAQSRTAVDSLVVASEYSSQPKSLSPHGEGAFGSKPYLKTIVDGVTADVYFDWGPPRPVICRGSPSGWAVQILKSLWLTALNHCLSSATLWAALVNLRNTIGVWKSSRVRLRLRTLFHFWIIGWMMLTEHTLLIATGKQSVCFMQNTCTYSVSKCLSRFKFKQITEIIAH